MPKKSTKSKAKTKTSVTKNTKDSHGVRPSVGIIFTLVIALIITITISVCTIQNLKNTHQGINGSKLDVFEHLLGSYIESMEFTSNDKPTMRSMTGYGVSDEDGVLYATFDFVPYDIVDHNYVPDGDVRHAIIYFWKDKDRGVYSHAFSYHDDASYHPAGTYVETNLAK